LFGLLQPLVLTESVLVAAATNWYRCGRRFFVFPGAQLRCAPGVIKQPAAVSWLSQAIVWFGTATYADEVSAIMDYWLYKLK
jgi:hypothetical protein